MQGIPLNIDLQYSGLVYRQFRETSMNSTRISISGSILMQSSYCNHTDFHDILYSNGKTSRSFILTRKSTINGGEIL